jgi:PKD repeat protein
MGGSDTEVKAGYITMRDPIPAVADFSGEPLSGTLPLAVAFTNLSSGDYDICLWDFGDGDTSSDCDDPGHTYDNHGLYTVSLAVSGAGGIDSEIKTDYIAVYRPVRADFEGKPRTGVAPLTVTFENESRGDYDTCAWEFGDGETSSDCEDPAHTYVLKGTYTVSLTVSGPGGTDDKVRREYITVYEPAMANFSAEPTSGIAPLAVEFENESTGDYESCLWDFGDGTTSAECDDPGYTYAFPGEYTVKLTVNGHGGMDTKTRVGYITVYEPVTAGFDGEPESGVAPLTVAFENASGGDYDSCLWEFGDGVQSAVCEDPAHIYASSGVYTVSLTVSGLGGVDTETKTAFITVYEPVAADFSATPVSGTLPLMVEFTNLSSGDFDGCTWDFGDGSSSADCKDVSHVYMAPGSYTVSLTVSGPGGEDTMTKADFVVVEKAETLIYLPILLQ